MYQVTPWFVATVGPVWKCTESTRPPYPHSFGTDFSFWPGFWVGFILSLNVIHVAVRRQLFRVLPVCSLVNYNETLQFSYLSALSGVSVNPYAISSIGRLDIGEIAWGRLGKTNNNNNNYCRSRLFGDVDEFVIYKQEKFILGCNVVAFL